MSRGQTFDRGASAQGAKLWLPLLAVPALVFLVGNLEAPLLLGATLSALALAAMLMKPQLATFVVVFLLYINAPAIAVFNGVPKAIAGTMMLLLGIPLAQRLIVRRERVRSDRIFGLMLAFLVAMVLSSLGARGKDFALERIVVYATEGVVLYWLIINTVTTRAQLRRMVWALLAAGAFLGSLSAYQAVTRSYDQQFAGFAERQLSLEHKRQADIAAGRLEERMYRADRADGPQLGANRYAQVMLVLVPLAFAFVRLSTRRRRWQAMLMLGLIGLAILLTYSRGGMVALVVLAWASVYVGWLRPRQVLAGMLVAALMLPVVSPSVFKRFASLGEVTELEDPDTDGSLRGRATEMLAALFVFVDHPVLGVGPGQYRPFYSIEYQQLPGIKFRDIRQTRRAHSLYFEMAAETGIVGLVLFLAIPLLLLRDLWWEHRRWRFRDRELSEMTAAIWLSLLGFMVTAMLLSHAFERYYWILVALASAALQIARRTPVDPLPGEDITYVPTRTQHAGALGSGSEVGA